jgi:hypothetical protein
MRRAVQICTLLVSLVLGPACPSPWEGISLHRAVAGVAPASDPFVGEECLLRWQAVPDKDAKEYRVSVSQVSGKYDTAKFFRVEHPAIPTQWVTALCSEAGIATDGTYYTVVQTFDLAGNASAFSNEASTTLDTTAPGVVILEIIKRPDAVSRYAPPSLLRGQVDVDDVEALWGRGAWVGRAGVFAGDGNVINPQFYGGVGCGRGDCVQP